MVNLISTGVVEISTAFLFFIIAIFLLFFTAFLGACRYKAQTDIKAVTVWFKTN